LPEDLSIELSEERQKIGVEVLIPHIELIFILRRGAIETGASSQVSEDGSGFVENPLFCDEVNWVILFVDLIELKFDPCKIGSCKDFKGFWREMVGIVKFFGCHMRSFSFV
jgi:hypothetical protein